MELESCLPEGIRHLIERLRLVDEGEVLCSRLVVRGSTYGTSVVKEDAASEGGDAAIDGASTDTEGEAR